MTCSPCVESVNTLSVQSIVQFFSTFETNVYHSPCPETFERGCMYIYIYVYIYIFMSHTYIHTYILTYARHCDPRARVCTLIPLILRRHACCSCLSETRHRRRRSSRNKKALRGCACMHRVGVCNTRYTGTRARSDTTSGECTGCLAPTVANYFLRIFQDVASDYLLADRNRN